MHPLPCKRRNTPRPLKAGEKCAGSRPGSPAAGLAHSPQPLRFCTYLPSQLLSGRLSGSPLRHAYLVISRRAIAGWTRDPRTRLAVSCEPSESRESFIGSPQSPRLIPVPLPHTKQPQYLLLDGLALPSAAFRHPPWHSRPVLGLGSLQPNSKSCTRLPMAIQMPLEARSTTPPHHRVLICNLGHPRTSTSR